MHLTCFAFAKTIDAAKVETKLKDCSDWLSQKGKPQVLSQKLWEAHKECMTAYKDQFMQMQQAESGIFNPEDAIDD